MPSSKHRSDLESNLEGFGLSPYESRAYIQLLAQPQTLPELAYHAGIPRTKVYSTVKSLARKKLVLTTPGKPVRCQAIPPEDCLEGVVSQHERRLRGLRKSIIKLKKLRDEARAPADVEEGRHWLLGARAMSSRLQELISSSRHSIHCVVDNWGLKLIQNSSDALALAASSDVDVKSVVEWDLDPGGVEGRLPHNIPLRVGRLGLAQSVFLFDHLHVILANGVSGNGIMINSRDLHEALDHSVFSTLWEKSCEEKEFSALLRLNRAEDAISLMHNSQTHRLFMEAVCQVADERILGMVGEKFVKSLEENLHLNLQSEGIDSTLSLMTSLLLQSLGDGAQVRYDPVTKILTVEASNEYIGLPPSIWIFGIAGLLKRHETALELLKNMVSTPDGTKILQAKMVRTVPNQLAA